MNGWPMSLGRVRYSTGMFSEAFKILRCEECSLMRHFRARRASRRPSPEPFDTSQRTEQLEPDSAKAFTLRLPIKASYKAFTRSLILTWPRFLLSFERTRLSHGWF